ncbi:AI-2E family transporter [Virgisporangium ochraceum]|uniref:AI-2E family transporter n=1 Tax=Virgisporangium ochraceum TaxID=65505 RepID=A0A8J4E8T2_9ACTN|nr:AI-2E family transporter [Virgisporangium ochraceum]
MLPSWLRRLALYGVCVLIFAGVVFVTSHVLALLTPVVLAIAAALLLAALFEPLVHRLTRARVPRWLAALVSVLGGLVLVTGTLVLVGIAAADEATKLATQAASGIEEIQRWLVEGLGLKEEQIGRLQAQLTERLQGSGTAGLQGAATVLEVLGSALLALVLLFFILKDGPSGWAWFLRAFRADTREKADRAGRAGWDTLTGYVRGIALIAAIDAIGIRVALLLIGVPLALPLAVLTFLACFVPILGATFAGVICVLVALAAHGPTDALLVLAAVIVVQQAEGNLLEPLIMGRALRLHPAVVLIAVAAGSLIAGIGGALLATPLVAVLYRMVLAVNSPAEAPGTVSLEKPA